MLATFLVVLVVLLVAISVRLPIAITLGLSGGLGLVLVDGFSIAAFSLSRIPVQSVARYSLIVVPMFILMGIAAKHARIAEDAFQGLSRTLRRVPGGLALATILACAGFAAVSGSSVATVVSVGKLAIAEMQRYGYSLTVAAGVVGSAGTLGILIPPSIPLVIYAIIAGESVGALLLAGILPGILTVILYAGATIIRAHRNPEAFGGQSRVATAEGAMGAPVASTDLDGPATQRTRPDEPAEPPPTRATAASWFRIALLFSVVMGGIYSGYFTTTEAATIAAALALIMILAVWWREPAEAFSRIGQTITEAVSLNGSIFALLVGGGIFSAYTVSAGLPQAFTSWVIGLELPGLLVVAILLLALVPMGMFLDGFAILLIAVPLMHPLVSELGFSGIWFGILFVKCMEIGLITPPLGMNAFVVAGTTPELTVEQSFKGVLAYLPLDFLTIAVIFFAPIIVTVIPDAVR